MESMSIGTEIPLGRSGPTNRQPVVEAYISRTLPGQFAAALELAVAVFDFAEANGATACRLVQLSNAGMLTDCLVASWEFENVRALGKLGDALGTDPAGQKIMETLNGPNWPDHAGEQRHLRGNPAVAGQRLPGSTSAREQADSRELEAGRCLVGTDRRFGARRIALHVRRQAALRASS